MSRPKVFASRKKLMLEIMEYMQIIVGVVTLQLTSRIRMSRRPLKEARIVE